MLRAKVLPEVLNQVVGDGISAALLTTVDGSLMGSSASNDQLKLTDTIPSEAAEEQGSEIRDEKVDMKVVGAIAAHAWGEYVSSAGDIDPEGALRFLLVELENATLAMSSPGNGFLVCAYAEQSTPCGLLKSKVETLTTYLTDSLSQINI